MTIVLSSTEFQRLVRIIQNQPEFTTQSDRLNLLSLTFGLSDKADLLRARLNLGGAPMGAAVELVRFLSTFGQVEPGVEALGVFLNQLLSNTGASDDADFMAELIKKYTLNRSSTPIATVSALAAPRIIPSAAEKYVFVSYARPDEVAATSVENYLKSAGFQTFRDSNDIRSGANWDLTIEQALNQATHMVLLLSASSMPYRKEVHREWFYFDQRRKPILPLYLQDCTLHSRLFAYNYIDSRQDFSAAIEKLMHELV